MNGPNEYKVKTHRYGAPGMPLEPGLAERYGAVLAAPRRAPEARPRLRTAVGLDGPYRSTSDWDAYIADAERQVAQGFFKHMTYRDRNQLDSDRYYYEQAGQV